MVLNKIDISTEPYKFAVIGGGPSGLLSFDKLKSKFNLDEMDIVLFEKDSKVCQSLESYGRFVKNHGSIESDKWNFLVSGGFDGMQIAEYFRKRYSGNYIFSKVKKISKFKSQKYYILETENGNIYYSKHIILATGIKNKEILAISKHGNKKFNCTGSHAEDLKKINFLKHELILVGSGDNVLFKANKIAKYIDEKYSNFKYVPISIFVKEKLNDSINPLFSHEINIYIQKKIVKIVNNCWDIQEVKFNRFDMVDKIICSKIEYQVQAPHGAFLGVHIGNEINMPKLIGCNESDFIKVGDLSLMVRKIPLSITGALQNVEDQIN